MLVLSAACLACNLHQDERWLAEVVYACAAVQQAVAGPVETPPVSTNWRQQ